MFYVFPVRIQSHCHVRIAPPFRGAGEVAFFWVLTTQKTKFSIKDFFSKCDQPQETADLVSFTEEILDGKLHFLYSVLCLEELLFWSSQYSLLHGKNICKCSEIMQYH